MEKVNVWENINDYWFLVGTFPKPQAAEKEKENPNKYKSFPLGVNPND